MDAFERIYAWCRDRAALARVGEDTTRVAAIRCRERAPSSASARERALRRPVQVLDAPPRSAGGSRRPPRKDRRGAEEPASAQLAHAERGLRGRPPGSARRAPRGAEVSAPADGAHDVVTSTKVQTLGPRPEPGTRAYRRGYRSDSPARLRRRSLKGGGGQRRREPKPRLSRGPRLATRRRARNSWAVVRAPARSGVESRKRAQDAGVVAAARHLCVASTLARTGSRDVPPAGNRVQQPRALARSPALLEGGLRCDRRGPAPLDLRGPLAAGLERGSHQPARAHAHKHKRASSERHGSGRRRAAGRSDLIWADAGGAAGGFPTLRACSGRGRGRARRRPDGLDRVLAPAPRRLRELLRRSSDRASQRSP